MVTVGDILEWIAAGLLAAASFIGGNLLAGLSLGLIFAFVAAAGCLAYFAQCHADTPLRRPQQQ